MTAPPQDGRIDDHAPGAFLLDGRVARDFGRHLQLVIGAENVLDRKDTRCLPVQGRRLYAGLVLRHERD